MLETLGKAKIEKIRIPSELQELVEIIFPLHLKSQKPNLIAQAQKDARETLDHLQRYESPQLILWFQTKIIALGLYEPKPQIDTPPQIPALTAFLKELD